MHGSVIISTLYEKQKNNLIWDILQGISSLGV